MLEKIVSCALITKLRLILLMKGDFNAANKIVFGKKMIDNARKHNIVPEDIYSKKNCLVDNGTLSMSSFTISFAKHKDLQVSQL